MDGNTTVKYLQHYLRQKDLGFLALDSLPPGPQREAQEEQLKHNLFLKLVEEVGEVSRAIFHGKLRGPGEPVKGTLDEELWDVLYYTLCLAEAYGIAGYRATNQDEFERAFQAALDSGKAAVIDCVIDKDAKVHPMVNGGDPATKFLLD